MIQGLVVDGCQPLVMDDGPTLRHSAFLKNQEAVNGYWDCIGLACVSLPSILASSHHITFEHLIVQEVALLKFSATFCRVRAYKYNKSWAFVCIFFDFTSVSLVKVSVFQTLRG